MKQSFLKAYLTGRFYWKITMKGNMKSGAAVRLIALSCKGSCHLVDEFLAACPTKFFESKNFCLR